MRDRLPRLLTSYHSYQDTDMTALAAGYGRSDLFADSGAYSARSIGADVTLVEYVAWLRQHPVFTVYANLDVIGDAEGTWRNQQRMEAEGLTPLPVFHAGSPWSYLQRYCDNYPYVALGGLVGNQAQRMAWLVKAFRMARVTGTVYHGFGVSRWKELCALPWHSTDASSWGYGHRYGNFTIFDARTGKWNRVRLRDHRLVYAQAPLIRRYGVDPKVLADPTLEENQRYEAIFRLSAGSWMQAEQYLRRRHGAVVHKGTGAVGPKCYLADSMFSWKPMAAALLAAARHTDQQVAA